MVQRIVHCPYCREPVAEDAVILWDGRSYCRGCVEAVSPELYQFAVEGGQLVDVLEPGELSVNRHFCRKHLPVLSFTIILFLIFLGSLAWPANPPPLESILFVLLLLTGIPCLLFWSGSYFEVKRQRAHLPRRVSMDGYKLSVVTPECEQRSLLTRCQWMPERSTEDELVYGTDLKQGLTLYTPEGVINCGHSREMLKHWYAFFILAGLPVHQRMRMHSLLVVIIGGLAGYLVGRSLGEVVGLLLIQPNWWFTMALLGVVDGICLAGMYLLHRHPSSKLAFRLLHPAVCGVEFFAIGFKWGILVFGFPAGMQTGLIVGILNAICGGLAAWYFRSRMKRRGNTRPCPEQLKKELVNEVT